MIPEAFISQSGCLYELVWKRFIRKSTPDLSAEKYWPDGNYVMFIYAPKPVGNVWSWGNYPNQYGFWKDRWWWDKCLRPQVMYKKIL